MYDIKADYMRNHFNSFLLSFFPLPTSRTPVSRLNSVGKSLGKIFGKFLIKTRQILQECEISKYYLKPLWLCSKRDIQIFYLQSQKKWNTRARNLKKRNINKVRDIEKEKEPSKRKNIEPTVREKAKFILKCIAVQWV